MEAANRELLDEVAHQTDAVDRLRARIKAGDRSAMIAAWHAIRASGGVVRIDGREVARFGDALAIERYEEPDGTVTFRAVFGGAGLS